MDASVGLTTLRFWMGGTPSFSMPAFITGSDCREGEVEKGRRDSQPRSVQCIGNPASAENVACVAVARSSSNI